ncbi:MAG: M48 family metallopeptidase [Gammaproteobacteria bacterium]
MLRTASLLVAACLALTVSTIARAQLIVSEKEVRREARVEWLSMKRHLSLVHDQRIQNYVQCVANDLIATLSPEQAQADWEVVVFDDDQINAFADPNYKIGVFTGLLRVADTPDALAAVIGHEVAHATEGHVMQRARKGARNNALVLLGSAATGISPDLLNEGAMLSLGLPYARDQETKADLIGLQSMAKAGFDPRAALSLWKNMAAAMSGKGTPPEFLSDHPADDTRLDTIVKQIRPALIAYNQAVDAGKHPNCQAIAAPDR